MKIEKIVFFNKMKEKGKGKINIKKSNAILIFPYKFNSFFQL